MIWLKKFFKLHNHYLFLLPFPGLTVTRTMILISITSLWKLSWMSKPVNMLASIVPRCQCHISLHQFYLLGLLSLRFNHSILSVEAWLISKLPYSKAITKLKPYPLHFDNGWCYCPSFCVLCPVKRGEISNYIVRICKMDVLEHN